MRLLVLGGPRFLGRAVIDAALGLGHEVTVFNRGRTGPDLFPEVEKLQGDRDGRLEALRGREWDAVVDTCGFVPRVVAQSATLLAGAASHYVFVSSVSVYASFSGVVSEDSPVIELAEPGSEDVEEHYGALKALCEAEVEGAFPVRATHVRPGLIVGPHDPTGRFTYWPHRMARGGEVLAPAPLGRPVQVVDVRDLGAWIVVCAAEKTAGIFNAVSQPFPFEELLLTCVLAADARPPVTAVDDVFLREQRVGEWIELPLWVDAINPNRRRFMEIDGSKASAAGLKLRALAETVRGTLEQAETVEGVGLTPEREAGLLRLWHNRSP